LSPLLDGYCQSKQSLVNASHLKLVKQNMKKCLGKKII
jgi:hypothetical protein